MQAAKEFEVRTDAASLPWWEAPPFQGADFASVLSAAATKKPDREPVWGDETDEAEETLPLTYEGALRARSAWMPDSSRSDSGVQKAADHSAVALQESAPVRQRRSASVTIRLSEEEDAQLKQRAAEAGLTISAYLRSCTLDVETLRAQVKQALAELRALSEEKSFSPSPRRWWQRMARTKSWIAQA